MATLDHLVAAGSLVRHDADLEWPDQPKRFVYFAPKALAWIQATLRVMKKDRGRDLEPYEQVEQALYEFVSGLPLAYGQDCRKLDPMVAAVWELKTEDVRLIGWAPRKSTFLVVCGCMKKHLTKFKDYAPLISETQTFRDALDLDEPKAITGVTLNAVF